MLFTFSILYLSHNCNILPGRLGGSSPGEMYELRFVQGTALRVFSCSLVWGGGVLLELSSVVPPPANVPIVICAGRALLQFYLSVNVPIGIRHVRWASLGSARS